MCFGGVAIDCVFLLVPRPNEEGSSWRCAHCRPRALYFLWGEVNVDGRDLLKVTTTAGARLDYVSCGAGTERVCAGVCAYISGKDGCG